MTTLCAAIGRPGSTTLIIATAFAFAGWVLHVWMRISSESVAIPIGPVAKPKAPPHGRLESPAVVALLTNGFSVPRSAVEATSLDLVSRGWLRLIRSDVGVAIDTRSRPSPGDALAPYEQQVLNHISSLAEHDTIDAGALVHAQGRLDRGWWHRFNQTVAANARDLGFTKARYTVAQLGSVGALTGVGLVSLYLSLRAGTDVAISDSWLSRAWWFVMLLALGALGWATAVRYSHHDQSPTDAGRLRASQWIGYRSFLAERIPPRASVIGTQPQQWALAIGVVTGIADSTYRQLPVVTQDPRLAWSEAAGTAHHVRVRFPVRPGYGQHPAKVIAIGLAGLAITVVVRRWLNGIVDGRYLASLIEQIPGQQSWVTGVVGALSTLFLIPLAISAWAIAAGAFDSVYSIERQGEVVRTRPPSAVVPRWLDKIIRPFGSRSSSLRYMALDDGHRYSVTSWLATSRTAAPQGSSARVRATLMLGYVRSCEPVGTGASNRAAGADTGSEVAAGLPAETAASQRVDRNGDGHDYARDDDRNADAPTDHADDRDHGVDDLASDDEAGSIDHDDSARSEFAPDPDREFAAPDDSDPDTTDSIGSRS